LNIEIANHLTELRKSAGLSQEALADRLGISRQAISKWERAEAAPDTENLIALAKLYNISLDELLLFHREEAASPASSGTQEQAGSAPPHSDTTFNHTEAFIHAHAASPVHEPVEERFDENAVRMLNACYPVLMTGVFFAMGLLGGWWHPGWMVFLTIPLYYTLIPALRKRDHRVFAYPVAVTLLYLILGFTIHAWSWGWLLYLTIPAYYTWKPGR